MREEGKVQNDASWVWIAQPAPTVIRKIHHGYMSREIWKFRTDKVDP